MSTKAARQLLVFQTVIDNQLDHFLQHGCSNKNQHKMEVNTFLLYIICRHSVSFSGLPTVSNTAHSNDISIVKPDKATNALSPDPYTNAGSQTYTDMLSLSITDTHTLHGL